MCNVRTCLQDSEVFLDTGTQKIEVSFREEGGFYRYDGLGRSELGGVHMEVGWNELGCTWDWMGRSLLLICSRYSFLGSVAFRGLWRLSVGE